jgi:glucokinase
MNVLGIDVGAGTIKSAVFADKAQMIFKAEEKTARSYPELRSQLMGIIARMKAAYDVRAVGCGVPGFISLHEQIVELSPNMPFLNGMALAKDIAAGSDLPLRMENDANSAALGEFLALSEPRPASFVHLTLGSGIGSGVILGGRVWQGACGFAAELGHLLVNSQGRPCGCGNRGCAETESSAAGIVNSYQELACSPIPLSSRDVFTLLQRGDEYARRTFQRAGVFLGVLLSQIVYALNPERISIGGGVAAAGEALLAPARGELARRVMARAYACTLIEPARLGNAAGMTGAAALARQLLP